MAGAVIGALFLWRQIVALVARAKPYVRRRPEISDPALIVNRWSGDGQAERYGLADAAREAGIRVIGRPTASCWSPTHRSSPDWTVKPSPSTRPWNS
jgi:hypothetical protein